MFEYVAGIIDARGHISINQRHAILQPRISVTTRRLALIEWLADRTGTKVFVDDRGYERRPCAAHCRERHAHVVRQSSRWTVDSSRATIVLYNVQPFIHCQSDEIAHALRIGLAAFPPARGDVPKQMRALGWVIPDPTRQPRVVAL